MECLSPIYLRDRDIDVPCGRCGFCTKTRKSDWVFRLEEEMRHHVDCSFITLTYANNELTFVNGTSQLVKEDLQKFFKRVRKHGYKFRYYAVGEYGSHTYRPHYHIILFGSVPEKELNQSWSKGLIHVGSVTPASVAYCCKYIINSKALFMKQGRMPPFAVQSRKSPDGKAGGIGYQYLRPSVVEYHKSGLKNYLIKDGQKIHLPKYYKDKIFTKRERSIINNLAIKNSIEVERKELLRLSKFHPNPLEYRNEMRVYAERNIRKSAKEKLII